MHSFECSNQNALVRGFGLSLSISMIFDHGRCGPVGVRIVVYHASNGLPAVVHASALTHRELDLLPLVRAKRYADFVGLEGAAGASTMGLGVTVLAAVCVSPAELVAAPPASVEPG